jgi:hypothetical protein
MHAGTKEDANGIELSRNPVYGGVPMTPPTAGADNIEMSKNPVYGKGLADSREPDSEYYYI